MQWRILDEQGGLRTFVLVLQTGDEAAGALTEFAQTQQLRASHFTAIGAFSSLVVAYFDWATKAYVSIGIAEQVEVLSLIGDVTIDGDHPKLHAHVVVGKRDGSAHGGHLMKAIVRPTLEVVLTETPAFLRRRWDQESQLALIDPGRES
jgi:predicted DNA-binding protein with PD1-like motif